MQDWENSNIWSIDWLLNDDPDFEVLSDDRNYDYSEEEDEVIIFSDHDSESQQEYKSDEGENNNLSVSNQFYIGRDKSSKWNKSCKSMNMKRKKNIMKIFPGPETVARGERDELTAFSKFMTIDMIDEIVKCTNLYIGNKRATVNYEREREMLRTQQGMRYWHY